MEEPYSRNRGHLTTRKLYSGSYLYKFRCILQTHKWTGMRSPPLMDVSTRMRNSHWTYPAAMELLASSYMSTLGLRLMGKAHYCYRKWRHGVAMSSECADRASCCRQKESAELNNWNLILFSIPAPVSSNILQQDDTDTELPSCDTRSLARHYQKVHEE